jgi:hypothetical protein
MCENQDYKHQKFSHCTRRFLSRVTFPSKPIFSIEGYVLLVLVLYIRKFPTAVSAWTLQMGIVFASSKGAPLAHVRNVHNTRLAGRCELVGRRQADRRAILSNYCSSRTYIIDMYTSSSLLYRFTLNPQLPAHSVQIFWVLFLWSFAIYKIPNTILYDGGYKCNNT